MYSPTTWNVNVYILLTETKAIFVSKVTYVKRITGTTTEVVSHLSLFRLCTSSAEVGYPSFVTEGKQKQTNKHLEC